MNRETAKLNQDERTKVGATGIERLSHEIERYNDAQRAAFRASYRSALAEFGHEDRAREVAHAAARGTPGDL